MPQSSLQAPSAVIMIRPHHFRPNGETARDNGFQTDAPAGAVGDLASRAQAEVSTAVQTLRDAGVKVHLFDDPRDDRPDAVFPNNWFSTHPGGHVAVYPMYSPNRRIERRADVLEMLKQRYRVQDIIDYSGLEQDALFLEGTGAMVLDHVERVAYAARSKRTSEVLLERFCTHFNYEPMVFDAFDAGGLPIYHTNVLMCIGSDVALIGLQTIKDAGRREELRARLAQGDRDVIELSQQQIANFAGNAIELQGRDRRLLAMSTRALNALQPEQRNRIEAHLDILPLDIPTIEMAGGSVRCTIAGIHLSPRPHSIPEGDAS
ncbi:arginine deiminase-related protein [Aliiroseovarius sp. S1339]|uniref:citrulline utilization hydrolase CtlX n=1 Tax=Aliiroseovarius sp. S1339 TaxID=2936990 RepID=UPI0020C13641|nr:arginine deiminase-related protein [Aliiroseovarius sp. S1339]MCK8464208.1 arginine deiminase-related protein [Aliiroseovarius sp. S1339]